MGAPLIPIAISAASTLFSAASTNSQAKAKSAQYERDAQVAETEQALRTEDRQRRMAAEIGRQRALYGAMGTDPNSGSAAYTQEQTAGEYAREEYNDRFNTQNRIDADRTSSQIATQEGNQKMVGTLFDFASKQAKRG